MPALGFPPPPLGRVPALGLPAATRTITGAAATRAVAAARTIAGASAAARAIAAGAAWSQRGLTVVSAEIHAVIGAATDIVALVEFVGDVCIVVAHAVPVIDIVLPVAAATTRTVDVDVVVGPVDVATPIASAAGPTPNRVTRAERQASRQKRAAARPVAGAPVIRRICRVGPRAIDHSSDRSTAHRPFPDRRLNDDDLLAALGFLRNLLLFRCFQLFVRVGFGAQPLDSVHHIGLLRQHGVAEFLGPVELVTHHVEYRRRRDERSHAFIPPLLIDGGFQGVVLEALVFLQPAAGLYDLERIGRRHHHLGEQIVRVKRDRRDQRIDFFRLEQVSLSRRARRRGSRLVLRARHRGKGNNQNEC